MQNNIKSLAIIAGRGNFPILAIKHCQKHNIRFQLFLLHGEDYKHDFSPFKPITLKYGQISEFIRINNQLGISNILMIGAVTKPDFKSISVDKKSAILLTKILAKKILGDDAVLKSVVSFFEKEGFNMIKVEDLLQDIQASKGALTTRKASKDEIENIEIASKIINTISQFDIGQSLVVAQKQIIAVEACEGTDSMINRVKELPIDYKDSSILVKLSKKKQSDKADLPTIGLNTIKNCVKNGIIGIAIEANKTLIIDKADVIKLANENNIFIIAI